MELLSSKCFYDVSRFRGSFEGFNEGSVGVGLDDEQPVEQVDGDPVRAHRLGVPDLGDAESSAVCILSRKYPWGMARSIVGSKTHPK